MQTRVMNSKVSRPAKSATAPKSRKRSEKRARKSSSGSLVFSVLVIIVLIWGWMHKGKYLTPEHGLGYFIGIAGGVAMLTLLTYPLRKRIPFFRGAGSIRSWFRLHMALGIIGPVLILYHANFGLGSLNSNVALWAMLIVSGSGIVGRYFYGKIHRGLYGKRKEVRDLMAEANGFRQAIKADITTADLLEEMDQLQQDASESVGNIVTAASKASRVSGRARRLRKYLLRTMRRNLRQAKKTRNRAAIIEYRQHIAFSKTYFKRLEQAAELSLYERLFAAWHVLHLPLFFLLIVTGIIHVIAVHLY